MAHTHIFTDYLGYNEERDTIAARCSCGEKTEFPRLANKRVVHSAHGAGAVVVDLKELRMADDEWTINETDGTGEKP